MNYKRILITGGCGFIGSNFINEILSNNKNLTLANVDCLTYAGRKKNISDFMNLDNFHFFKSNIIDNNKIGKIFRDFKPELVINFAAESHVDNSITNPNIFVETNVIGTLNLLNHSLENNVKLFVQVSTDEVYGDLSLDDAPFEEDHPIQPSSPYSASKAAADHLVMAYNRTFNLNTIITRCSNNYGPHQLPEKLIPVIIQKASSNQSIPVYGDGKNVRDWIHVSDHCKGIINSIIYGKSGEIYNFGGSNEKTNLEIVKYILDILNKPHNLIKFVKDRPGHDFRYAINFDKAMSNLNWHPKVNFIDGLEKTVDWYLNNKGYFK